MVICIHFKFSWLKFFVYIDCQSFDTTHAPQGPDLLSIGVADFVLSGYFRGKRSAEAALQQRFPETGVSLRPSFIHGTRQVGSIGLPLSAIGRQAAASSLKEQSHQGHTCRDRVAISRNVVVDALSVASWSHLLHVWCRVGGCCRIQHAVSCADVPCLSCLPALSTNAAGECISHVDAAWAVHWPQFWHVQLGRAEFRYKCSQAKSMPH